MKDGNRGNNTTQPNGHAPSTSRTTQWLTQEARAQIPNGDSNTTAYLSNNETAEDVVMGVPTNRGEEGMTKKMAEWDASWGYIGGK
ncbi:hypothetical protein VTL71DRAFT_15264 [Oculimacula yallundae]|uniref:Uncharacterized protein n=1 Tax=Oculimacula yallundae TaxID=86028 RepID=A0ABR4CI54_9HELO